MGASEAETFWLEFLRKLKRRGLNGVKLVIAGKSGRRVVAARSQWCQVADQLRQSSPSWPN